MINEREKAIHNISRILAVIRYDIEQRQSINDLSLNIHGENYFRDIFNYVFDYNLENDNFETQNSSCIDLIDKKRKLAYQITTTRKKEKIEKTLKALSKLRFKDYDIKILYLLEKAQPNSITRKEFKDKFGIDLYEHLLDYTDLIKAINNLETNKLLELERKYFRNTAEKYTDEIVLNLVIKHLIAQARTIQKNYDDDFGNIDTIHKISLNKLNSRVSNKIQSGLDFISIIQEHSDENLIGDLRILIIEDFYAKILIESLSARISSSKLVGKDLSELQNLAVNNELDFNKIIINLHNKIEAKIEFTDYNSMHISWIIISFFFELCDIGIKT